MSLLVADRRIDSVEIIDDNPNFRQSIAGDVKEADVEPIQIEGPLPDLNTFANKERPETQAAICDHYLKQSQYARFNGAELAARLYQNKFPAILCTRFSIADIDSIRRYLKFIPVIIQPDKIDPDSIAKGFESCIYEFKNQFHPSRRPWRTLVRVEYVDRKMKPEKFFIVLPGWNSKEIIGLLLNLISQDSQDKVVPGARFHAQVNQGAEDQNLLFFEEFEFD